MTTKPTLLGIGGAYPNYGLLRYGSYSTDASIAAGFPTSNLGTIEPTETARIKTLDPGHFAWASNIGNLPREIGGIGLVNSNISPGGVWAVGKYMILRSDIAPNGVTLSNATGAYTDIDEAIGDGSGGSGSDAAYITPSTKGTGWSARVDFTTHFYDPPATGAHMGIVVVRAGIVEPHAHITWPMMRVELWENNAKVRWLGARAVTSPDQVFIFTFDWAELADPTGTNVQIKVFGSPDYAYAGPGDPSYCRLDAIRIYYFENSAVAANPSFSGFQESPAGPYDPTSPYPYRNMGWVFDPVITVGSTMAAWIIDDQVDHIDQTIGDTNTSLEVGLVQQVADGYVELGGMIFGPAFTLRKGWAPPGPSSSVPLQATGGGSTLGGLPYGSDDFKQRQIAGTFLLYRDEKDTLMELVDWRKGSSGPFFLMSEPDLPIHNQQFLTGYVTVKETSEATQLDQDYTVADQLFSKSYTFLERL